MRDPELNLLLNRGGHPVKLYENKTIHNSASTDRRDKTGRRRTVLRSDTRELLTKNFPTLILILAICNFQFRLVRALAVFNTIFLVVAVGSGRYRCAGCSATATGVC
jgi:hypothetical protein